METNLRYQGENWEDLPDFPGRYPEKKAMEFKSPEQARSEIDMNK